MAGRIHLLDSATINKIAAGEVIERPASIVKELVENSLDAGASQISVSIMDGGKARISVRDDGCGMSREEAEKCFDRYATSKVTGIDDLLRLSSYGFRGEALSSIAAVAKVTLRTRERRTREGTEAVVRAGVPEGIISCGCPEGTEVLVEDLFFNLPARRKSLKSKGVEIGHCRDVVLNYLLCRPEMSFIFESDGQAEISHVQEEGIQGALALAFGPKVAKEMVFGEADGDGVRVQSRVSRLEHTRSSPSDLKVFVNNRPVKHAKAVSAVVAGYGSRLMKDRYPVGVVRIFAEPSLVDVNVHPTKREVRFSDEQKVLRTIGDSIRSSFETSDLSYKYDLTAFSERFKPVTELGAEGTRRTGQETLDAVKRDEQRAAGDASIAPLAQVMNTYILAEAEGGLLLIDQHAASERIVYEELLRAAEKDTDIHQKLLTPAVLNLTATERSVLEEHRQMLEKLGFAVEPFGGGSYALRSVPTVLGVAQAERSLRDILGDLAGSGPKKRLGLEVIWRVACHTAIRAGEPLSNVQMRQLVSSLMKTDSPYTCEHGRPTMVLLSPADLERLFKRRV